jgi:hypothetical protein
VKRIGNHLLGLGALALLAGIATSGDDEGAAVETASLTNKAYSKWSFILPKEVWTTIDESIPIAHSKGDGFATEIAGVLALSVDTNGDGKLDDKVKGAGGFVKLRGKTSDGDKLEYPVRIRPSAAGWEYSTGGAMQGKILGRVIRVIDQNNNGIYNEYGRDAMIVGSGSAAAYLSRTISVDGKVYDFEVSADGLKMTAKPYSGEVGTLSLATGFDARGKLESVVVTDRKQNFSFNLAKARAGLTVPTGSYALESGFAKKGAETVWISTGKMRPLEVKPGEVTDRKWGAPVQADFSWTSGAGTITVNPDVVYYGAAGEVYHSFQPNAKSPKLVIRDKKKSNKIVLEGRFPGC